MLIIETWRLENAYTSTYEDYFHGSLLDIVLECLKQVMVTIEFGNLIRSESTGTKQFMLIIESGNLILRVLGKGEDGKCVH